VDRARRLRRQRTILVVAAAVRAVLALAAIPLAPFLYRKHVAVLVLLRPTKEVLLFAGFAAENGDISLGLTVLAALPILLGGVWLFFALGRAFGPELQKDELPGVAGRLLPQKRVDRMREALKTKGDKVILLGRLAAMPSSLIAAAAGASKFSVRRFLIVDTAGALISLPMLLALGWFLDEAYESAGPWLSAVGILGVAAVAVLIGRTMSRPAKRPATRAASSRR
jgi:membrane protein DedA with SNARE-associated domain